jgi:hypothetical protein
MVLILIFAEVLGLYGCVLPAAPQRLSQMSLKVGPWQAHRSIDYEHESIRWCLFMTFTTTFVYSYKTTSVCLIVAFTNGSTDLFGEWLQGIL